MTDSEVSSDFAAVLEKVRTGMEVVVEQDHRAVALIRSPMPESRLLSQCIALAEKRGTTAIPDEGFMNDVTGGIAGHSKPWTPPIWE